MLVIGLDRDDPAQQPLHLVEAVELLVEHRLLVEEVGVVGKLAVRLRDHLLGVGVHLVLAQQLGFGEQLGARVAWRLFGNAADQLAREGTFYIDTAGNAVGGAPMPEAGFVQPVAQFGREGAALVAITGPVASTVSFGQITSAGTMRQVQLGGKLLF